MPPEGRGHGMLDRSGSEDSIDISTDGTAGHETQAYDALQTDVSKGVTDNKYHHNDELLCCLRLTIKQKNS